MRINKSYAKNAYPTIGIIRTPVLAMAVTAVDVDLVASIPMPLVATVLTAFLFRRFLANLESGLEGPWRGFVIFGCARTS